MNDKSHLDYHVIQRIWFVEKSNLITKNNIEIWHWPSIWGAPDSTCSGHVRPCIYFYFNFHTAKSAPFLGVKGLGPISTFSTITSEDSKPLTQRIGPSSRCKVALSTCFVYTIYFICYNLNAAWVDMFLWATLFTLFKVDVLTYCLLIDYSSFLSYFHLLYCLCHIGPH